MRCRAIMNTEKGGINMTNVVLYGVLSLVWMFLAGARFSLIFVRWETKKWNIILCIVNSICAMAWFVIAIMSVTQGVSP